MAGSRRDFNYVADDGTVYAINADESNVELVMGAQQAASTAAIRKPANMKQLRSVRLIDATGIVSRVVPVLTAERYNALNGSSNFTLPANDVDQGTQVAVTEKIPEKFTRIPKNFDTGKTDGDNP